MKKTFLLILLTIGFTKVVFGQIYTPENPETRENFVEKIKKAHRFERFHAQEAVTFDMEIKWGNDAPQTLTLTTLTNSGKIKLQYSDGKTVIFDGQKTWLSSTDITYKRARFDIFTYHYFFMFPFKVNDNGTNWQILSGKTLDNNDYARGKLSFKKGTGDSADDWYIVHRNKITDFVDGLAYIVTYIEPQNTAEKHINGITYHDVKPIDGVMIATKWKFWQWTEDKGFYNLKGTINIKNIRFIKTNNETFAVPKGSILL